MIKQFKIVQIVKKSESPFILTLNDTNHLIGNKARALENYMKKGMHVLVNGYYHDQDFLVEDIDFVDGVLKGAQIDTRI